MSPSPCLRDSVRLPHAARTVRPRACSRLWSVLSGVPPFPFPVFWFLPQTRALPRQESCLSPPCLSLCVCLVRVCLPPSVAPRVFRVCVPRTDRGKGKDGVSRLGFAPLITPGRGDEWDTRARPEFALQIHEESIYSMLVFHGMSYTMYWSLEGIFP